MSADDFELAKTAARIVGYHDAVGVGIGHVRNAVGCRNSTWLMESAQPRASFAGFDIHEFDGVVVGIGDHEIACRTQRDTLRMLHADFVACAVHIAKVEQACTDEIGRAHV